MSSLPKADMCRDGRQISCTVPAGEERGGASSERSSKDADSGHVLIPYPGVRKTPFFGRPVDRDTELQYVYGDLTHGKGCQLPTSSLIWPRNL